MKVIKACALFLMVAMVAALMIPVQSFASDQPRVIIMGEDAREGTVRRYRPAFTRVKDAIANSMIEQGYDVLSETAQTLDTHAQARVHRADSELIQTAKDVSADVLVIFSIFPRVKKHAANYKIKGRVTGRLISVADGRRMGNFEITPLANKQVPPPLRASTAHEALGDIAQPFGREVGDVLVSKLNNLYGDADGNGGTGHAVEWTLTFDGFSMDDMMEIEDYLVIFSGYDSHRPCGNCVNTSKRHAYWYKSTIGTAKMKRNMYKLMKKLQYQANIQIADRTVEIKKLNANRQRKKANSSEW